MTEAPGFSAIARLAGVNPYVNVPPRIVKQLGHVMPDAVLVKVAAPGVRGSSGLASQSFWDASAHLRRDGDVSSIGRLDRPARPSPVLDDTEASVRRTQ